MSKRITLSNTEVKFFTNVIEHQLELNSGGSERAVLTEGALQDLLAKLDRTKAKSL